MDRSTIFNGKTHYKWPFSIAMLNYQRVNIINHPGKQDQKHLHSADLSCIPGPAADSRASVPHRRWDLCQVVPNQSHPV